MALELNLTLNTNDSIEGVKGKYYPRVEYKGTMSTLQLAKHMAEHTTSFSKGEINGMLTDLVSCIKELCLLGYVVKIEDLGLFKASVEGNGLTLKSGAKVSAGVGQQRSDEELTADITRQQCAISAVKIIMQATGETTMSEMTRAATTSFTSKTKQLVKSLTGSDAEDNGGDDNSGEGGENTNGSNNTNGGGTNTGGDNTGGSGTGGGDNGGGDNGGGGNLPGGDDH
jgi:predicted histone-like DNA-binding protein